MQDLCQLLRVQQDTAQSVLTDIEPGYNSHSII